MAVTLAEAEAMVDAIYDAQLKLIQGGVAAYDLPDGTKVTRLSASKLPDLLDYWKRQVARLSRTDNKIKSKRVIFHG